jgi:hypothetical protein
MFLILIISQIKNLKIVEDVLGLRKCYQCGGETLDPVVKHSVSDSMGSHPLTADSQFGSLLIHVHLQFCTHVLGSPFGQKKEIYLIFRSLSKSCGDNNFCAPLPFFKHQFREKGDQPDDTSFDGSCRRTDCRSSHFL